MVLIMIRHLEVEMIIFSVEIDIILIKYKVITMHVSLIVHFFLSRVHFQFCHPLDPSPSV